jgi:hypothetical protein
LGHLRLAVKRYAQFKMRIIIFISICLLVQNETFGQNIFLSNQVGQNAIIGIENILEFSGLEKKGGNLIVSTDNGEIKTYINSHPLKSHF